ncbi:uncharacterized protein [Diabrotica undecimpunctata]|uniref:uncharacterized protein n=1 Tax=Diabrotica undecimpunctata TaxID=50387 RepID=UPI003B638625
MEDDTCEHHPRYLNQIKSKIQPGDEKLTTSTLIRDELEYASNYRAVQKKIPRKEVYPKNRPFELPFELCRLRQLQKRKKKKSDHVEMLTKKPTMLERSIMSQDEYMRWLAMPNIRKKLSDTKQKKVKRCQMSPCPPRCVQLSAPPKRRVLSTWIEYQNKLPAEVLLRFQQMLHTDQNLKLRDADYYYKKIDKRKRRLAKRKKRLRLKRKLNKERGKYAWIDENIFETTRAILEYLRQEPLYSLNYKQLLLSDQILNILDEKNVLSKPSRTSKNTYQKSFIETSDKLAVWMDTLTKFVDVQAVESAEDIPPITISTLMPEEEEEEIEEEVEEAEEGEEEFVSEEEEEYEESVKVEYEDGREIEKEYEQEEIMEEREHISEIEPEDGAEGMIYEKEEGFEEGMTEVDEKIDLQEFGEEGDADFDDKKEGGIIPPTEEEKLLEEEAQLGPLDTGEEYGEEYIGKLPDGQEKEMDLDLLRALIQIYEERSPSDYLRSQVEHFPGYTYAEILKKMKAITLEKEGPKKSKLEEAMIQWLRDVAPDEVNERTLKAIHEYACALLDELKKRGFSEDDIDKLGTLVDGEDAGLDIVKEMEEIIKHGEAEGQEQIDTLYPLEEEGFEQMEISEEEAQIGVDTQLIDDKEKKMGEYIYGHKPTVIREHCLDAICCLSLKIWAVWLLEVIHNAHTWTKWMHEIIGNVRSYASIVRGDVKDANGKRKVLLKSEWEKFVKGTEKKVIAWRQYSAHVNELSDEIIENFRNKEVYCCPKCLQDHLIKNVVTAHNTFAALTEAMQCAQYWRRCLDDLVETTASITVPQEKEKVSSSSEESLEADEIEELSIESSSDSDDDDESIYELEEIRR